MFRRVIINLPRLLLEHRRKNKSREVVANYNKESKHV
jgi:hypothetical protein